MYVYTIYLNYFHYFFFGVKRQSRYKELMREKKREKPFQLSLRTLNGRYVLASCVCVRFRDGTHAVTRDFGSGSDIIKL